MTSESEIEAAIHAALDVPRDTIIDILEAAEKVRALEDALPIPTGVYFRYGDFYDAKSCMGMGMEFYGEWKRRAWEFPVSPETASFTGA